MAGVVKVVDCCGVTALPPQRCYCCNYHCPHARSGFEAASLETLIRHNQTPPLPRYFVCFRRVQKLYLIVLWELAVGAN